MNDPTADTPLTTRPDDFDDFWAEALGEAARHPLGVRLDPVSSSLRTIEVFDVAFSGYGGEQVKAWLRLPSDPSLRSGAVVEYVGYGSGRGEHFENLLWASAGYTHLTLDTRGQGSVHSVGHTADPHGAGPAVPGFTTKGIRDPREYYYRRLIVDAVRAVAALCSLDQVDPASVAVFGASQGGGIALAVAGLVDELAGVVAKVPFLCDIPTSMVRAEAGPYLEIVAWLRTHSRDEVAALRTLSYVDAVNFAQSATAPALISAAGRDKVCPLPGIRTMYEAYAGPKALRTWPYGGHDGGGAVEDLDVLEFLERMTMRSPAEVR